MPIRSIYGKEKSICLDGTARNVSRRPKTVWNASVWTGLHGMCQGDQRQYGMYLFGLGRLCGIKLLGR